MRKLVAFVILASLSVPFAQAAASCAAAPGWNLTDPMSGAQYDVGHGDLPAEGNYPGGSETGIFKVYRSTTILASGLASFDGEGYWTATADRASEWPCGGASAEIHRSGVCKDSHAIEFTGEECS